MKLNLLGNLNRWQVIALFRQCLKWIKNCENGNLPGDKMIHLKLSAFLNLSKK